MVVYRISKLTFSSDLSGTGARLYGGRWNSIGVPVLYTASSISLAMLECLVHFDKDTIPTNMVVSEIEIPRTKSKVISQNDLPTGWDAWPHSPWTQQFGDEIFQNPNVFCVKFPSSVNPKEFNVLINPFHHRHSEIKIIKQYTAEFDERLFKNN